MPVTRPNRKQIPKRASFRSGSHSCLRFAINRRDSEREIPIPVITRAAERIARTGSSGLFARFCPLAILLSADQSRGLGVGDEITAPWRRTVGGICG